MSSKFQFKKEARLYAQYSSVVDKVRGIFDAEITRFFDALRDRMRASLHSRRIHLQEELTGTYRCWWIADNLTKNNPNAPYVWVRTVDTQTAFPGVLHMTAATDKRANEAHRQEFEEEVRSNLRSAKNSRLDPKDVLGGLFGVVIDYGDGDPVAAAVRPALQTLIALHNVERRLLSNAKKKKTNDHPRRGGGVPS